MPDGRIRFTSSWRSPSVSAMRGSYRLAVFGMMPATIPPYLISVSVNHAGLPRCRVRNLLSAIRLRIALIHFRLSSLLRSPFLSRAIAQRHHVRSVLIMFVLRRACRLGAARRCRPRRREAPGGWACHAGRGGRSPTFLVGSLGGCPGRQAASSSRGLLDAVQDSRSSLEIIPQVVAGNRFERPAPCAGGGDARRQAGREDGARGHYVYLRRRRHRGAAWVPFRARTARE